MLLEEIGASKSQGKANANASTRLNKIEQPRSIYEKRISDIEKVICQSCKTILKKKNLMKLPENHEEKVSGKSVQKKSPCIERDEDPEEKQVFNDLELEYKQTVTAVYEILKEGTFFLAKRREMYPRIVVYPETDPRLVFRLFEYGFLDTLYCNTSFDNIKLFEETLQDEIKSFADSGNVFLKFFSISPEVSGNTFIEAFHVINIGHTSSKFSPEVAEARFKPVQFSKEWMQLRRARGVKAIRERLERLLKNKMKAIARFNNWILVTQGGLMPSKQITKLLGEFKTNQFQLSEGSSRQLEKIEAGSSKGKRIMELLNIHPAKKIREM